MSGKFELAPGVDASWQGDLTLEEVLNNFEEQGGQRRWRPHIPGDAQRMLFELGQIVINEKGEKIPAEKIPQAEMTTITIDNNATIKELEDRLDGCAT